MFKRTLGILLLTPFVLSAVQFKVHIELSGDPLVGITTFSHTLNALGYKYQIETLSTQNSFTIIDGTVIGSKSLIPSALTENLQDEGIKLLYARMNHGTMELGIDVTSAVWNIQALGVDEGAQMPRSNLPYWFRVESAQEIHVEPPYGGKWYPDVSVLDASMHVLSTYRSDKSMDELKFSLPDGSYYLKVSNTNGMKVLREGMWVESMSLGR